MTDRAHAHARAPGVTDPTCAYARHSVTFAACGAGYLYFLYSMIIDARFAGRDFFFHVRNWLEAVNIFFYACVWFLWYITMSERPDEKHITMYSSEVFYDFRSAVRALRAIGQVKSCTVFLNWLKVQSSHNNRKCT